MSIPGLRIKGLELLYCIIQGGMGARVVGPRLTRSMYKAGGLGVLSSAGLKDILGLQNKKKYTTYTAVREEIEEAMSGGYPVGMNVMRILDESYDETIRAALDAKVSALFLGAGVPKQIKNPGDTALVLIVSSARALKIILRFWKQLPDAIVLEGPKAGGHLGFKRDDLNKPEFSLENLLPEVLEIASKYGIPVITAGGIYTNSDIQKFLNLGASGVQMGTRFAVTKESELTTEAKQAIVDCTEEDILVVENSPCGFPFRILRNSPAYIEFLTGKRILKCQMGYVLGKDGNGNYTVCKAHPNHPEHRQYFCICRDLIAAIGLTPGVPPMYTVGSNAYRIRSVVPVAELMAELTQD